MLDLLCRSLHLTPQVGQFVVEQFDHVEAIKHVNDVLEVLTHHEGVGRRHVCGDGLNLRPQTSQALPKRRKCIGAFTFPDENHGPAGHVQYDSQILLALANADLNRWRFASVS